MAKLIVREGPGRGTAYELVEDATKIGRDPGNAVQIPSETISRTHAEIVRRVRGRRGDLDRARPAEQERRARQRRAR